MSNIILVTYATYAGSTAGVAEAIGKALATSGLLVEIRPMREVRDLTQYQAVVAGSPIHAGRWLPEAVKFVQTHQKALAEKPFAAFLTCVALTMKNKKYHDVAVDYMRPVRELIRPVSEGYFAGELDFSKIPFSLKKLVMRIIVALGVWKAGDQRDWKAINAWADSIRPLLLQ